MSFEEAKMKTCETCQFWADQSGMQSISGADIRRCSKPVMLWDACGYSPGYTRTILPELKGQKVFVQDGSDYHAELYTRSDFGCIEHQPHPKDSKDE